MWNEPKHHSLNDILIVTILAVICGADGFSQIALFGRSKIKWLKTFLELPNGIPSHDTFGRPRKLSAALDPAQFERWITSWTANLAKRTAPGSGRLLVPSGGGIERRYYISSMPGDGDGLAPTHGAQDNSQVENVLALYQAAHRYGTT